MNILWVSGEDGAGETTLVADSIAAIWGAVGHTLVHWPLTAARSLTPDHFHAVLDPITAGPPPRRIALLGALTRQLRHFDAVMVEQDLATEFRVAEAVGRRRPRPRLWLMARRPLGSYLAGRGEHVAHHPRRWAEALYPHFDAVFTLVTGTADDLIRHFDLPQRRLVTVPWPIPAWALPAAPPVLLPRVATMGFVDGLKGTELLVQCLGMLRQRDVEASLLVVGDGPRLGEVRRVAAALDVPVSCLPIGREGFAEMARGGVFHAPQWLDGTGADIVMGAAAGLPLTAVAAPEAAAELLQSGSFGRITGLGDLEGLAAALLPLLTSEEHWGGYHRSARVVAAQHRADVVAPYWAQALEHAAKP
jgi:glycosyltransferase involved in cell wall biosynthesis